MKSCSEPLIEKIVDREDDSEKDGWPQKRQLNQTRKLPRAGAVDDGGFLEILRNRLQGCVVDDHVVAGEFPRDDVSEREEQGAV